MGDRARSGLVLERSTRRSRRPKGGARQTFLYAYLCGTRLWLLLGRRILVLLHAKNLCDRLDIRIIHGDGADLQHGGLFAGRWWGEVEV